MDPHEPQNIVRSARLLVVGYEVIIALVDLKDPAKVRMNTTAGVNNDVLYSAKASA